MIAIAEVSAFAISWSSDVYGSKTYQEMVGSFFGPWGLLLLEVLLFVFTLLVCMYIQTGIADEIQRCTNPTQFTTVPASSNPAFSSRTRLKDAARRSAFFLRTFFSRTFSASARRGDAHDS